MEYTIKKLGALAGVTTRTLRFYDEIGLLKPSRMNSSGYRIYGAVEVDRLQQILLHRAMGLSLDQIKSLLEDPNFDSLSALKNHQNQLLLKKQELEHILANVEKTIAAKEGRAIMSDRKKFEGLKQRMLDENEQKYGNEIRENYGKETVERSNHKFKNMTEEQFNEVNQLASDIQEKLAEAFREGNPGSPLAQEVADLHRQWLSYYWDGYTKEAHAGLAQMYVDDPRFTSYYDKEHPGTAVFLRDAILIYTQKLSS